MNDSEASVNVCPKWFGESVLEKADGQLRGADGRTLQDYGKSKIWFKIGSRLRQYDCHVVEVTPECRLLVRKRSRNTPREATHLEVRRETRTLDQEKWCVLRQGADRSPSQVHSRVMCTS